MKWDAVKIEDGLFVNSYSVELTVILLSLLNLLLQYFATVSVFSLDFWTKSLQMYIHIS